jgi:DNA modification methylase
MEINKIYQETCLETLKKMPNEFLDCVITSPPYWQLRDYGHKDQWGLEPTFNDYLENLWSMMDEIYRVLKPSGTVWVNLGDSYSTQSGTNLAISKGTHKEQDSTYLVNRGESGNLIKDKSLPNKCLLLIPHRFAIGCIDRGWIVRNDCIWAKRNGMPESVTDRFSKKHEYFFFMVKSEKYFFDLDAIRDKQKQVSIERLQRGVSEINKWVDGADGQTPHNLSQPRQNVTTKIPKEQSEMFGSPRARQHREGGEKNADNLNPLGKNPGSVSDFWDIPTKPSSSKHYASYNDALLRKPILAGCPENGLVYDPFMGTGSTAEVAIRANRNFIGSEINSDYIEICNKRLKPFLESYKLEF